MTTQEILGQNWTKTLKLQQLMRPKEREIGRAKAEITQAEAIKVLLSNNVKVLCVCGGLVALTVGIAPKLNRITAVDFSTSAAITQNTCYAQYF